MLICDRMGVSYPELYGDDMPYMIVDDYLIVMAEEAAALKRQQKK